MQREVLLSFVFLLAVAVAQGDPARLDAQRVAGREFAPDPFGPVRWLDGAHYATLEPDAEGVVELVRYEAVSGAREVLVGAGVLAAGRERPLVVEDYAFSPDGQRVLLFTDSERVWRQNTRGEYHVLDRRQDGPPRRLGGELPKSSLQFAKFSPDGGRVAYVSGNDLWVEDCASGAQTRLTKDGSATTINGTFDWVYEEEFDCRDGFRWSPDGTRIAYWQLDCSGVGEFYMIDNLSDRYSKVIPVQYPKAGTRNSACRIGVIPAIGGETVWMQTPGDPRETYLPRMEWHPDGKELAVQWLPRAQNHLVIYGCDASSGRRRLVHEERDAAYVDVREDFRWAGHSRFFWTDDTTGWRRTGYIMWEDGRRILESHPQLDVMDCAHRSADEHYVYVSPENGTQRLLASVAAFAPHFVETPLTVFVTPADQAGWHDYQISTDGSLAIHTYSKFDTPPLIDLVRLPSHERVRVLVDNAELRERYAKVAKGKNEFFQVETEHGVTLDGWTMYPPDFDPAKRWPVVFHVYGEPWSQTVKDTWFLNHHLFHRWLTQLGYVVMSVDARGTPAPKGRDWRKALHQQIGILSSHDWNLAVTKLCARHAWMDRDRLAIWGWSGGGAMTLNMLFRHQDLFAAGMSVAPVTDIALYDTIYQERYCGDPREVPEVYRECSPITYAKDLRAPLLLVHGTGDDNVHYQNSERLVDELIAHGKLFECLAYPNRTHAIREGRNTRAHLYASLADFLQRRVPAGPR